MLRVIGTGQFGVVRIALHRPSGDVFALNARRACARLPAARACRAACRSAHCSPHVNTRTCVHMCSSSGAVEAKQGGKDNCTPRMLTHLSNNA